MPKEDDLKDNDPFTNYLVDVPKLSYVQPEDKLFRRFIIDRLEVVLGRRKIEKIYSRLKAGPFNITTFFQQAIAESKLEIVHLGLQPDQVRADGPLIFIANHPFGILDGLVLCELAARVRGDLRILINSALCQDRDLAQYFLPIDFRPTPEAIKTNIRSKNLAIENLSNGIPVLIFPSGMVSTAKKMGFGSVKDGPWTTFAAKLVRESKATVVPVYFHGQNSRKFHIASHVAEPLRMGMLIHEATNKFGRKVEVTIGEPISWSSIEGIQGRQALTDVLYEKVQSLRHSKTDDGFASGLKRTSEKIRRKLTPK
jgi:putative hemolysin